MNRLSVILATIVMIALVGVGCSGGNNTINPIAPANDPGLTAQSSVLPESTTNTYLWGYYDVYVDLEAKTATAVPNRNSMFTMNVVVFLNNNPAGIGFHFNGNTVTPGHVAVDLDVSIKHPIPAQPKFNGYDVRGVFVGNGSGTMLYNSKIKYPVVNTDQMMMPSPSTGFGGPDGYTRWFNAAEFTHTGFLGYTQGKYAAKNYTPTATLNPYKYFADGLGTTQDLWDFLTTTTGGGVFSSGTTNTRNYYIDFPVPNPGVKFAYAVLADWKIGGGQTNAPEALVARTEVTEHPYFVDATHKGGNLGLDVTLFNWTGVPTGIKIESPVLTANYTFTSTDLTPTQTGTNWAKFHALIPATNVTNGDDSSYIVIAEYDTHNYTNTYGVPNSAGTDPLASFFRYGLTISDTIPNHCPEVSGGVTGNASPALNSTEPYTVTASDADLDPLTYNWTVMAITTATTEFQGTTSAGELMITWDDDVHAEVGKMYNVSCTVSDNKCGPVFAIPLITTIGPGGANNDPICDIAVDGNNPAYSYPDPVSMTFTAAGSSDPDGDPITYKWNFDGTGFVDGPVNPTHTYTTDYDGPVTVRVTDLHGAFTECSVNVVALNNTLYYYDGAINDGGIAGWTDGSSIDTYAYCPDITAWQEENCVPYSATNYRLARTPFLNFPQPGYFKKIHLEIWHWGDMQPDDNCYGTLGKVIDTGGGTVNYTPNWRSLELQYIEGFDFNNVSYPGIWSHVFGDQTTPEYTHFDASSYAGATTGTAVGFQFEEFGAGNPDNQLGWMVRKMKVWVETADNYPPIITSGVSGPSVAKPDDVSVYNVAAVDPDLDPLTYSWKVTDQGTSEVKFTGSGDGAGALTLDWANDVGAIDGNTYLVDCDVSDGINPPVAAKQESVHVTTADQIILYEYDGTVDDGGLMVYNDGGLAIIPSWEYCPAKQAWDETQCGPFGLAEYRLLTTPRIDFPAAGTFTKIHLEITHWCDTPVGNVYATLGIASDSIAFEPNWASNRLVYIEGQDFNEPGYPDWQGVFGSEATPAFSHLDASDYAGNSYSIIMAFGEWGSGNPSNQDGWNIRHLKVWVEP